MKKNITVVSLGPGDPELLTLATDKLLKSAKKLVLRTGIHGVKSYLDENGIAYETLDAFYDQYEDFDEMHAAMAQTLWQMAEKTPIVYAVADTSNDGSVLELKKAATADAVLTVHPGVSRTDSCLAAACAGEIGFRSVPAMQCAKLYHQPSMPLLVTEINTRALAGDVKLRLSDIYPDETKVLFFPSTAEGKAQPKEIFLCELDRQKKYDHTVCVFIPAMELKERERFCFEDLLQIMETLRGPGGCKWDRKQTHESLRRYLIEEAWEVAAAIDEQDPDHLYDELGDVLLQVVFQAHVGKTHGEFDITDVTTAICSKMISRHPHIFAGDTEMPDWEELKKQERGALTAGDMMRDVPTSMPSLMRASKVQKKAATVGFDWDSAEDALPKVYEEADEVKEAFKEGGAHLEEEVGDLFFACVNVGRLCGLDCESALQKATEKFIKRYTAMEKAIILDGKAPEHLTLAEMDVYWNRVKNSCKSTQ